MLRPLLTTLALVFALVPPGIFACRLEAMILAESSEGEAECPDDDGDDCDCVQIQQDCITSSGPVVQVDPDSPACWTSVLQVDCPSPNELVTAAAPFRWPGLPPLYLMLRALLL